MGYAVEEDIVRVDMFKDTGKWYESIAVKWIEGGYDSVSIHESLRASLFRELKEDSGPPRLSGMTAVCLEPYHKHSHPIMLRNWDNRLHQD